MAANLPDTDVFDSPFRPTSTDASPEASPKTAQKKRAPKRAELSVVAADETASESASRQGAFTATVYQHRFFLGQSFLLTGLWRGYATSIDWGLTP